MLLYNTVLSDIFNKDLSSDFRMWFLLVDHKFRAMGQPFQIGTFFDDKICNLKNKVKEKKPDVFFLCKLDPLCLTMWKTEGELVLNGSTAKHLEEILKKINVDDEDTIQMLDEYVTVAELQSSLADDQILLAQFPGMSYFY